VILNFSLRAVVEHSMGSSLSRQLAVLVTAISLVLAYESRASGEDAQSVEIGLQIDRLVAHGRSAEAIPLARKLAALSSDSTEAWQKLRTLAGWNSDSEAELEALDNLVRLRPADRDLRVALAQRLLWAQNTKAALPHARWLLADPEVRDEVALEVTAWVLIGEKSTAEARAAVKRWIAAKPNEGKPRWLLADLTHWSVHWRSASDQYAFLKSDSEYKKKVADRMRMLARDHPIIFAATGTYWSDNTGVTYQAVGAKGTAQLPRRLILSAEAERGRWKQEVGSALGQIGVARALVGLRLELFDELQPEILSGIELDSEGHNAFLAMGRAHLSIAGKIFGRCELGWDRYRLSLASARSDIRTLYQRLLLYAEPLSYLFIGIDASHSWLSDSNHRWYSVLALGAHNTAALQVEPRVFAQIEKWNELRDLALPYFTTPYPFAFGGDLTLRFTQKDSRLRAEIAAGAVHQGGAWALTPRGSLAWELFDHFVGKIAVRYIGAVAYRQHRVDASIGYRF